MAVADRERWRSESFIGAGWLRHLPDRALLIVKALVARGPLDLDALESELRRTLGLEMGWLSAAWEPAHPWTDAELDDLRREVPEYTERLSAAEVIAQEAKARAVRVSELESHAARFGVPAPTTMGGTRDFLIACGVLLTTSGTPRSGAEVLELAATAPLPGQVLKLSDEEAALEERMRSWRARQRRELSAQASS